MSHAARDGDRDRFIHAQEPTETARAAVTLYPPRDAARRLVAALTGRLAALAGPEAARRSRQGR